MNKIEKIIKEDLVNYQSPNSGQGYDWHNKRNPVQMSLVDILKSDRSDYEKARKVLPHQMQTTFDRLLKISDDVNSLKEDFIRAYSNPMIKDDESKKKIIKGMVEDLNAANDKYREVIKKLDQIQF